MPPCVCASCRSWHCALEFLVNSMIWLAMAGPSPTADRPQGGEKECCRIERRTKLAFEIRSLEGAPGQELSLGSPHPV